MAHSNDNAEAVRLDKWLWQRVFTRPAPWPKR